jgi:polyhydroxyalkanoate synthesis regulator phasin
MLTSPPNALCLAPDGRYVLRQSRRAANAESGVATDWLKILDEEIRAGNKMRKVVPKMLSNPDITLEQVKALFSELEKQAQFVEKLKAALEGMGHDFPVLDKAQALEARYADLAANAAEKLKAMRQ